MPHAYNNGIPLLFWQSQQDICQQWRISLASLVLFAAFLTNQFGLSTNSAAGSCPKQEYYQFPATPSAQCLVPGPNITTAICREKVGKRMELMRKYHFKHCDHFQVYRARNWEPEGCDLDDISTDCEACLKPLENADSEAYATFRDFSDIVLRHFDCETNFSTKWHCSDCEASYKNWACSLNIPYFDSTTDSYVRPCSDYCQDVEEQCPYLAPHMEEQYAGEPFFLCTVPNIPNQAIEPTNGTSSSRDCHKPSKSGHVVQRYHDNLSTSPSDSDTARGGAQTDNATVSASSAAASSSASASLRNGRTLRSHSLLLVHVAQLASLWYYRTLETHTLYRVIGLT